MYKPTTKPDWFTTELRRLEFYITHSKEPKACKTLNRQRSVCFVFTVVRISLQKKQYSLTNEHRCQITESTGWLQTCRSCFRPNGSGDQRDSHCCESVDSQVISHLVLSWSKTFPVPPQFEFTNHQALQRRIRSNSVNSFSSEGWVKPENRQLVLIEESKRFSFSLICDV